MCGMMNNLELSQPCFSRWQIYSKFQQARQEMQELQEEHIRERQELEQTQEELTRELKLKYVCTDGHEEYKIRCDTRVRSW